VVVDAAIRNAAERKIRQQQSAVATLVIQSQRHDPDIGIAVITVT
jgi:hypothetical protein